jgi:hypothetical protein
LTAYSFRITLEGIIQLIDSTLEKINNGEIEEWKGIDARMDNESFEWEADWCFFTTRLKASLGRS